MLADFHVHSVFCDGKNTPEEIVREAIERGGSSIGFSGHGYTPFDLRYCMKDMDGYVQEITRLKKVYGDRIRIYLGVEEDMLAPVERDRFDYIIGSAHYIYVDGEYCSVDSGVDYIERCLEHFGNDPVKLTQAYYSNFCTYIKSRKPDIVGHFDLITKYSEVKPELGLQNESCGCVAERYLAEAAESGCVFEVNAGAMARGLRSKPYPAENLLHVLKKKGARVLLSSDSHEMSQLAYRFDDLRAYLREIGFRQAYVFSEDGFKPYDI